MGISFLAEGDCDKLKVEVSFATYVKLPPDQCYVFFPVDEPEKLHIPPTLQDFVCYEKEMQSFRAKIPAFGGLDVVETLDYLPGRDGLPASDVLKFLLAGNCSLVVRPSGTEPKMKVYISVSAPDKPACEALERRIAEDVERYFR